MIKVIEFIKERENYPVNGENYTVGKVEDGRYFFSWGPEYPTEEERVPQHEIREGESGITFHTSLGNALNDMQSAIDAVESTR